MPAAVLERLAEHTAASEERVSREAMLALLRAMPKETQGSPALFTPAEKCAYRDRYRDDNRAVFERYVEGDW